MPLFVRLPESGRFLNLSAVSTTEDGVVWLVGEEHGLAVSEADALYLEECLKFLCTMSGVAAGRSPIPEAK